LGNSLEHLVHDDSTGRLQSVFEAHDLPLIGGISGRLDEVIVSKRAIHEERSHLARGVGVDA